MSSLLQYEDFILQLDLAPGGQGYLARVIRSPTGEAEAPFVNPLTADDLAGLWQAAQAQARGGDALRSGAGAVVTPLPRPVLEALGSRLFDAVFHGPVRSCWARSLEGLARQPGWGLRLKLQLNLEEPRLAPLHEIPWEYLFSLEQGGFLGLRRRTPLLRHVRLPFPPGQPPVANPLRLLGVTAEPKSMPGLSLSAEGEVIAKALSSLPGVETDWKHNPTVEELREALLRKEYHVLHFMGHGGFDEKSGQGGLWFASASGKAVRVGGALLAPHLADLPALRLVFLNACETARANAQAPYAGVATALLRAGIPAVLAMQLPIRDKSALAFSRTVYHRLAAGDPIDIAVTEGRLAIARGSEDMLEWGTPALFLRGEDGRLFAPAPTKPPEIPGPQDLPRKRPWLQQSLVAAVTVALVGIGTAKWLTLQKPESVPNPSQTAEVTERLEPPQPTETEKPDPPKPVPQKESAEDQQVQERKAIVTEPPPPPPPVKDNYEVSEQDLAWVPDLKVQVSVRFFERNGFQFARFSLAPEGEGMLQQAPVMGPGGIDFPAAAGTYHLDVLNLDLEEKRASVRVRFSPA